MSPNLDDDYLLDSWKFAGALWTQHATPNRDSNIKYKTSSTRHVIRKNSSTQIFIAQIRNLLSKKSSAITNKMKKSPNLGRKNEKANIFPYINQNRALLENHPLNWITRSRTAEGKRLLGKPNSFKKGSGKK